MRAKAYFAGVLAALVMSVPPVAVAADGAAGVLKASKGTVFIERGYQRLVGAQGQPVVQADRIITGPNGTASIQFADDTVVSLGPSSRFTIDQYPQPAAEKRAGAFQVTLAKGRMGVVSGKIAHGSLDAMKVRTPDTILGVRGTRFVVDAR